MPPSAADKSKGAAPLYLVTGDDDFSVKARARQIYDAWCKEAGGFDHEIIEATASNSGDALKAIGRLREALQTLPFFGGAKVVWLQNCNFLGEERAATSQAVTEALLSIAEDLKKMQWDNLRLLISSPKVDKRKTFYKTLDKLGTVETFAGWSIDSRDWADQAEMAARQQLRDLGKEISEEALAELVLSVGPNRRALVSEVEKLSLYLGNRTRISPEDVETIVSRNKQARSFALADALGRRDLPLALKRLDEEVWSMETDSQKSEVGLLFGLIFKMRAMLLMKEMTREGWIRPDSRPDSLKAAFQRVPPEELPQDSKFNPLALHPFVLYTALEHSKNYSSEELVRAMELLLICNLRMVTASLDPVLVLQETITRIIQKPPQGA